LSFFVQRHSSWGSMPCQDIYFSISRR
jgi:hypothetical protein